MDDKSSDPIDHARTTRQHAGETMKNGANVPGLASCALAVLGLVLGLAAFASGEPTLGTIALAVGVVAAIFGGGWLFLAHRRVRQHELHRAATEPDVDALPPTS